MSATVLSMSISLDGFIAGPDGGSDHGLADGVERLHDWIDGASGPTGGPGRPSGVNGQVYTRSCPPARSWPAGGRSSPPPAGAATTTTACRSSSSPAAPLTI